MNPSCDQGTLFIISAPSGTGKSTLMQRLTSEDPHIRFSVSHTTRPPRAGESDGVSYHFVERATFEDLIQRDAFLEWACYADNFYGTSREPVMANLNQGLDVILEIEVVGARLVREKMPNAVSIFIMPPHYGTLRERLEQRGKDTEAVIDKRLRKALGEMEQAGDYDYLLVNDNLETCYEGRILDTFPRNG